MGQMTSPGGQVPEFTLHDRMLKSLEFSGKSREQLAADLEVTYNTIGNYLNPRKKPARSVLIAWAFATGVQLEWLETGKTAGPPPPDGGAGGTKSPLSPEERERRWSRHAAEKSRHADDGPTHRYAVRAA